MPIQQVIAYTQHTAKFTQSAAIAGGQLDVPGAASAAMHAIEAACAAYTHAHADLMLDAPTPTLDETAHHLSDLATEAARAAKAVARSSVYSDWGLAKKAASVAHEAAIAARSAADAAESDVTDPTTDLGREAAKQVMSRANVEAEIDTDPELRMSEALRPGTQWDWVGG